MTINRRKLGELMFVVSVCVIGAAFMLVPRAARSSMAPAANAAAPTVLSSRSDWPSMTFTYRVDDYVSGPDAQPATQVWKVEYQDAQHWRKTLVDSTADASTVGTVVSFIDGVSTTSAAGVVDASTGNQDMRSIALPDGSFMALEQWLVPMWQRDVESRFGASSAIATGPHEVTYSRTSAVPCHVPPTGQWTPPSCSTDSTYQFAETFAFRTDIDPPLPILGVNSEGGATIWQARVTDVVVTPVTVDRSTP